MTAQTPCPNSFLNGRDAALVEAVAFAIEMASINSAPYWNDDQKRAWWRNHADQDKARRLALAAIDAVAAAAPAPADTPERSGCEAAASIYPPGPIAP